METPQSETMKHFLVFPQETGQVGVFLHRAAMEISVVARNFVG